MSRFWIDKISSLQPYVPGEQPTSDTLIKLNTNEHALPPSEAVLAAIKSVAGDALRRYPDSTASPSSCADSSAQTAPEHA